MPVDLRAGLGHAAGRKRVEHAPKDASFRVHAGNSVRVVPAQAGRSLDAQATKRNLFAAMFSTTNRHADLAVATAAPSRTTEQANAMGITGLVGSYETFYGGVPNRIHNVQVVSHLIDNHTQVEEQWLEGVETVGITSGASAPEELVERLVELFRERGAEDVSELRTVHEDVRFMLPKEIREASAAASA